MKERLSLRLPLLLLIAMLPWAIVAQPKSYRIEFKNPLITSEKAYLVGYEGGDGFVVDSTVVKKHSALFKGKKDLPAGMYEIIAGGDSGSVVMWPLLLNKSYKFSIELGNGLYTVTGSDENLQYGSYLLQKSILEENGTMTLDQVHSELDVFAEALISSDPEGFVAKMIKFEQTVRNLVAKWGNSPNFQLSVPEWIKSISPFQDPCFLYAGSLTEWAFAPLAKDLSIQELDMFFDAFDISGEIGRYYFTQMMLRYNQDSSPEADEILIHLYDKYYLPSAQNIFNDEGNYRLQKTIERKRRTQIGAEIPVLEVKGADGKMFSNKDLQRSYTVIWFWDPDCEDCQIETPELHQFYLENADTYDFEVFAVSITDDVDYWKSKVEEWQLSWINSCYGLGGYNYDFVDYLSLISTPVSFLLDENHRILYRNFTPEQLKEYFENLDKNNE